MKFLCDVHISYKVCKFLEQYGHQAIHVNSILNKWFTEDSAICEYADENNNIVITKDEDFRATFLLKKKPKKLIRIILGNISNKTLTETILHCLPTIENLSENEYFFMEIGEEINIFYP